MNKEKLSPYRPLLKPVNGYCPKCGRPLIPELDYCWLCFNRFLDENNISVPNEEILYISLYISYGWGGYGPNYHIAINTVTKECSGVKCKMGSKGEKDSISNLDLPDSFVKMVLERTDELFHVYLPPKNGSWYDLGSYNLDVQQGTKTYRKDVDDLYVKYWPILKDILDILENN